MLELTELEKNVLRCLQEAKYFDINYKKISQDLTVYEREIKDSIAALEKKDVVKGYSAIIDAEKLGFITAFIRFDVTENSTKVVDKLKELAKEGRDHGFSLQEIFLITGDKDIQLKVKVKGLEGYRDFVTLFEKTVTVFGVGEGSIGIRNFEERHTLDGI